MHSLTLCWVFELIALWFSCKTGLGLGASRQNFHLLCCYLRSNDDTIDLEISWSFIKIQLSYYVHCEAFSAPQEVGCIFFLRSPTDQCTYCYCSSFYSVVMLYMFITLQIIWPSRGQELFLSHLKQTINWWGESIGSLCNELGIITVRKQH